MSDYTELKQDIVYIDFPKMEVETGVNEQGEHWIDLRTYDGEVLISLMDYDTEKEARQALQDKIYKY